MDYFPLSVQENLIFVSIDIVNVVLDLKCIRVKYMYMRQLTIIKLILYTIYLYFHKISLEFREVLFGVHIFIKY